MQQDIFYISECLKLAREAALLGEVPVAAILTRENKEVARAHNLVEKNTAVTQHAEILVMEEASKQSANWRLTDLTLYVTLEPCPMCISAIRFARISRIVFGAYDPRLGACGSKYQIATDLEFGPAPEIIGGLLEDDCVKLLQDFFKTRRTESKLVKTSKK